MGKETGLPVLFVDGSVYLQDEEEGKKACFKDMLLKMISVAVY